MTLDAGPGLSIRLACREPFDAAGLLGFLALRAIPGVEQVTADRYTRTVRTTGGAAVIELIPQPGQGHVLLRATLSPDGRVSEPAAGQSAARQSAARQSAARQSAARQSAAEQSAAEQSAAEQSAAEQFEAEQFEARCRRVLDADADPAVIDAALAADGVLAPLVQARPGLRVPGSYDGFELAVRAVLGQQVSVAAARTFAGRLAAQHGPPAPPGAPPGLTALFPSPAEVAGADLSRLGLTTSRQRTLRALATATATGRLSLDPGADLAETAARLAELPGIGPWTIGYIMMRAGDPDRFPATDLGVRRAMARLGAGPEQAARWRPWRSYAVIHLWTWETDHA